MKAEGVAYAKINLFLDVVGRRGDGYHLIDGVMQSVEMGDVVRVTLTPGGEGISLRVEGDDSVPTDSTNLAWRAAERFLEKAGLRAGVELELEKRIPAAGGLAGGSSDAACVLRLLNGLAGENTLSQESLSELAAGLGADLSFCLESPNGAMRTEGIGEVLTPVPALPDCAILIANDGEGVSTPWAYRLVDEVTREYLLEHREQERRIKRMLDALKSGSFEEICAACRNTFEAVIMPVRPKVRALRKRMWRAGAGTALMSGSGPSVFGLFADREAADRLCEALKREGVKAFVTRPRRNEN
ncbi:MAG TPA: 4-(cytidine 5'-diphospho)-2-C-methyl-D-erythritol kinase [Clostridiales bacterium]|nr:4-(cytidine 5'-diphospho)-2-C-methyl-D-erythritol kinase [Clostridiales bacterium]